MESYNRILQYAKNASFKEMLHGADVISATVQQESCGDEITIYISMKKRSEWAVVDGQHVRSPIFIARYMGTGCALSVGSAAFLCNLLEQCVQTIALHSLVMHGDDRMFLDKLGLPLGPVREKCALLPWHAWVSIREKIMQP